MSTVLKQQKVSEEAFFNYLHSIEGKAEWLNGEIFDMAGGSGRHSTICGNVIGELRFALKGKGCVTHPSDLMYRIPIDRSLCFPDASVICGKPEYEDPRDDIARNPVLIIEVLSKDTERYCRSGKFMKYASIPSLREYVLIDQYEYSVEVRSRHESGLWDIQIYTDINDRVHFQSLGVKIPMTEIYMDVVFE